jgi:hypothetical protein
LILLTEASVAKRKHLVAGFLVALLMVDFSRPPREAAAEADDSSYRFPLYASAEETAQVVGTLALGESTTPMAETQSAGGIKWYLVKTKSGVVGWIKQSDDAQSKKLESFFRSLPAETSNLAHIPIAPVSSAPKGSMIVPVMIIRNSIIVPVTLNRTLSANLLLDTGASMTMISRRIATALALYATSSRQFSGVGGNVTAQIARVDSLKVGDAEVNGMPVSIHDLSQTPAFEGLLGMDFLGRFQVSVDTAKRVLVLNPR